MLIHEQKRNNPNINLCISFELGLKGKKMQKKAFEKSGYKNAHI